MMAAEKWYEYQKSYARYGLDMRPVEEEAPREKKTTTPAVSGSVKVALIALAILIGVFFIGLIISTAYSATLQYDINQIGTQMEEVQADIDNLNVKIKAAANLQTLEDRAVAELGMVYPTVERMVYLDRVEAPSENFSLALREDAYTK
ncbi:MAG: hypothetical protein E7224_03265 [Clostridiales bacterium]|nr:hypothetical protein [Clostridiales bacterium]